MVLTTAYVSKDTLLLKEMPELVIVLMKTNVQLEIIIVLPVPRVFALILIRQKAVISATALKDILSIQVSFGESCYANSLLLSNYLFVLLFFFVLLNIIFDTHLGGNFRAHITFSQ